MKESDVWKLARSFGGISVRYGGMDIYEIIMPGGSNNKCCIVVSDTPAVDDSTKKIAKSINERCYVVGNERAMERVMMKTAKGVA